MKHHLLPLASLLLLAPVLKSSDFAVSIDGFADPTNFSITTSSQLSLRVAELVPAMGTNASTHFLVEGLSPLADGTQIYASTYQGINATSGEVQDLGVIYLQMPAAASLPEGTVSSPIVGVVQRSGPWGNFTLVFPQTSLGGSSGAATLSAGDGTLSLTLERGAEAFTGTTAYSQPDADTIELQPFTLVKDGTVSYPMSGATLKRDGQRYFGTLTNLSPGAAYDSLLYSISMTAGGDLAVGEWNSTLLGWVYGFSPKWGYSIILGFVYMDMPWIYQASFGWMQYVTSDYWFYSPVMDWIYVLPYDGGQFRASSTNWAWNNFLRPN